VSRNSCCWTTWRPIDCGNFVKAVIASLILILVAAGCSRDDHDHPDLTTGEQLYNHHCAECHGEDGTGKLFDVIPANILTKKSPIEIMNYITTATGHERQMPVFKTMPKSEARLITEYLLELRERYETAEHRKPPELMIEP
jgi:mono/diheme cytochrome c family protein